MHSDISQALAAGATVDKRLAALRWLRNSPLEPSFLSTLIIGLTDPDARVYNECRRICIAKLEELEGHPELQDRFVGELLERSFAHGSANNHRAEDTDNPFAMLLDDIVEFLLLRPFQYEHYRSLLLLRACDVRFIGGNSSFAQALVRCHRRLVNESERSDTDIVRQVFVQQKMSAYRTASTSEKLLQDYLIEDRSLLLEQIDSSLLSAYADLMHTHPRNQQGVLTMLQNLHMWVRQLPHTSAQLRPIIEEVMPEIDRSTLNLPLLVQLQIKAGAALIPGPSQPNDMLRNLRTYYTFTSNSEVVQSTMHVLTDLPQLRARLPELYVYLSDPALHAQSTLFWIAALNLVGAMITGLNDYVSEDLTPLSSETWRNRAQRTRTQWQIELRDRPFRTLLQELSVNRELDPVVRCLAWRTLLECLPQDYRERVNLFEAGLADPSDELFLVSIDVARSNYQRDIWRTIEQQWKRLTTGDAQTPHRRKNLQQICRAVGVLHIGDSVRSRPSALPPLIGLALDDSDPEVRQSAMQAVAEAGLNIALQAELRRRQIARLREQITSFNDRAQQLEQEQYRLSAEAIQTNSQIARRDSQIAGLQQQQRTMIRDHERSIRQMDQELSRIKDNLDQLRDQIRHFEQEAQNYELSLDRQISIKQNAETHQYQIQQQVDETSALTAMLRDRISMLEDELRRATIRSVSRRPTITPQYPPEDPMRQPPRSRNVILREQHAAQAQLAAATSKLDLLHIDLELARAEVNHTESEYNRIMVEKRHSERSVEARRQRLEDQMTENARLTRQMTSEQARYEESMSTNQREISNHEAQQEQARAQLAESQRKMQFAKQETQRCYDNITHLTAEVASGERQLTSLTQQIDDEIKRADDQGRNDQHNHERHRWEEQELWVYYGFCLERYQASYLSGDSVGE